MKYIIIALILGIALGVVGTMFGYMIYGDGNSPQQVQGLYYSGGSYELIKESNEELEPYGDWVCVNVADDMDYPRAYDICVHECSHKAYSEIYAEQCENNFSKCMEFLQ